MSGKASQLPRARDIDMNRAFCEVLNSASPWTPVKRIGDRGTVRLMHLFPAAAAILVAGVAVMGSGQPAARPPGLFEVGRPFPVLALPDAANGKARSITEFRGRKIILHVFASW